MTTATTCDVMRNEEGRKLGRRRMLSSRYTCFAMYQVQSKMNKEAWKGITIATTCNAKRKKEEDRRREVIKENA